MTKLAEPKDQATAYMNQVIAIMKKYGLGGTVPEDEYDHAVESVTAAFKNLLPHR